ncbi:hypothetical protein KC356_g313 [Hortaea werneckii]|nr:hypothetical protein KC356_g313 [Hortaea werneckii]
MTFGRRYDLRSGCYQSLLLPVSQLRTIRVSIEELPGPAWKLRFGSLRLLQSAVDLVRNEGGRGPVPFVFGCSLLAEDQMVTAAARVKALKDAGERHCSALPQVGASFAVAVVSAIAAATEMNLDVGLAVRVLGLLQMLPGSQHDGLAFGLPCPRILALFSGFPELAQQLKAARLDHQEVEDQISDSALHDSEWRCLFWNPVLAEVFEFSLHRKTPLHEVKGRLCFKSGQTSGLYRARS